MRKDVFIKGEWKAGDGPGLMSVDPARGETLWSGAGATPRQVRAAFEAAREAFEPWALTPLAGRVATMERYRQVLEDNGEALAELISRETGKPRWEGKAEAASMAAKVALSVTAQDERAGEWSKETDFGRMELAHKPLGVMFVLGPYNFPGHLPNGHIVPALLAGNTIVFKPSELTPAVGAFMVEAFEKAGLPEGVLNLVQGGRETGTAALQDDNLNGVLFTGSWATGSFIHKTFSGRTDMQLALEMGGNNPLVVWDASDVEAAARIVALSSFITTGQRCSCARRLIVPAGPAGEAIIEAVVAIAQKLPIDAWDAEPEPFMGPLVTRSAADDVLRAQSELLSFGGKPLLKAGSLTTGPAFLSPGVIDVTGARAPDEEIFGPLVQVRRVETFEDAVREANNTRYGLSAGLVSEDEEKWTRFRTLVRAGVVNWNRPTPGASGAMPFGGPGRSGNLRPSAHYAADYCAYPVATQLSAKLETLPVKGL